MAKFRDVSASYSRYPVDTDFYEKIRAARGQHSLVDKFVLPPFSGKGFVVNGGQSFRVIQEKGPQVGVVAVWNAHDPKETYAPVRNRTFEGVFIKPFTRMWSDVPWLRPMMTCIEDTVVTQPPGGDFHHHRFWTHCTSETMEMRSGRAGLNSCRTNLMQAIEPFGLKGENIYCNINVFQKVRIDPKDGKYYAARSDSKAGDYIEFYAEMDLLVAVSVCPSGDNTRYWSKPEENVVLPLGIETYDTGIEPAEAPTWSDWRPLWKGRWLAG